MDDTIDHVAVTGAEVARLSGLIREADLTTPVDHLGRWRVRDVVAHLGGVHRWATRVVTSRSMDGPGFRKSKLTGTALCDWFDAGADELLGALAASAGDEPCPNFNPGSVKTVAWWSRRQAHETTVHRWDVERALDCTTPIAPALATDGIDEYLDVFVRTRGKQSLIAPLVVTTNRPKRSWTLAPAERPGRVDVVAGRSDHVQTELTGRPEPLLLTMWGRIPMSQSGLSIDGDPAVALSLTGDG